MSDVPKIGSKLTRLPLAMAAIALAFGLWAVMSGSTSPAKADAPVDPPAEDGDVGAEVIPFLDMAVTGGKNEFDKVTTFTDNAIHFGAVHFLHPETVATGDAYIVENNLRLEAVIDVMVRFAGIQGAAVKITRLGITKNPFHAVYYSPDIQRSASVHVLETHPKDRTIKEFEKAGSTRFRLLLDINPKQSGEISDRFTISAGQLEAGGG